jgi:urea transport system permease protein
LLVNVLTLVFLSLLFIPGLLFADERYWLLLFNKFLALAIFALSVDLIWGYTGLLSLGQGLYFGMGVYAVGYSLSLQKAARDAGKPLIASPDMAPTQFMEYCRLEQVPGWIGPLIDIRLALVLAIVLPLLFATAFGYVTFRLRVKGVYFSLITQALLLSIFTLVDNQQPYTGGRVGMTYLPYLEVFGHRFTDIEMNYLITTALVLAFLVCAALMRSKFGKVLTAIRDNENRVLALGYDTAMYKTFIFALAAALAGLAGALYVSTLRTAGPDVMGIAFSINVVIFVAVGGRGTLAGAVLGALLVNLANTYFNNENMHAWGALVLLASLTVAIPTGLRVAKWWGGLAGVLLGGLAGVLLVALICVGVFIAYENLYMWVALALLAAVVSGIRVGLSITRRWGRRTGVIVGGSVGAIVALIGVGIRLAYHGTNFEGITLANYLALKDKQAWPVLLGSLFILVVVFLPEGIVGSLQSLAAQVRRAMIGSEHQKEGAGHGIPI